jgi:hypothetical protein
MSQPTDDIVGGLPGTPLPGLVQQVRPVHAAHAEVQGDPQAAQTVDPAHVDPLAPPPRLPAGVPDQRPLLEGVPPAEEQAVELVPGDAPRSHPLLGAQGRRAAHPADPTQPRAGEAQGRRPVEGHVGGGGEEQVVAGLFQSLPDEAVVLGGPEQAASGLGEPAVVDGHPLVEPGPA